MKYYIIAGEASGDLHGANLMKHLNAGDASAEFRCWGGDRMAAEGGEIVKHYRDLAFMGFVEVVMNLRTIMGNLKFCKADILAWQPDVVIMIDYPGFNLRIADFAHKNQLKVFYYISPQIWAWKQSRVHQIKRNVDKMFVILPFEQEFYQKFDYEVEFVGHPLLDAIADERSSEPNSSAFRREHGLSDKPLIALLPGSRKQEIGGMLPLMLEMIMEFPDHEFVIAGAPSQSKEFYGHFMEGQAVKLVFGETYRLLQHSEAALVTSGTATLETALFEVPEAVCYRGSRISVWIARQLVKVKYISLVNLIMDQETVRELIQADFNKATLKEELHRLLHDKEYRGQMLENCQILREKLGGTGASATTANRMLKTLREG